MSKIYDFEVLDINGKTRSMAEFKNKVLLIVNTASQCGFTNQYKDLEDLQKNYGERGFAVLGFPCNQFGAQEPGDAEEIKNFCKLKYDVSFPMFAKVEVNGDKTSPLYAFLKSEASGLLGSEAIKWNFTKFLVNKKGEVIERFAPTTNPSSLAGKIEKML